VTDTATNAAGATMPVGTNPIGVAAIHVPSACTYLTAPTA
jgi:hypothetical protein